MEQCSMDPYEQQLLSVFDSYDVERRGSLDHDGLVKLCNTLQLEEQGSELIKCLLTGSKIYVTFPEFKDGLLTLLGHLQNNQRADTSDSESESPDRELSPKFVYGTKKYGRRSRPEDSDEVFEKIENKPLKNVHKVQRSNSQNDVTHSKKRKTSNKLKRCTSFPGHEKFWAQEENPKFFVNLECNERMLRTTLEQLDVGRDGFLNQFEMVQVCESLGLNKLTNSLLNQFTKHETEFNDRISVDELLDALQKEDLYEVASPADTIETSCLSEDSFGNKSIQYISLGPDGSGIVTSQAIIELWENAGIQSAPSLLQELGFTEAQISVSELGSILEDELRALNDSRNISCKINPQVILLQATIALYQSEVKYLKTALEQLNAERDKLRCDIADANFRASLLAQEVDDNVAKMEKTTQKQVRLLEQRHSEVLKEITSQFTNDKEQMSILTSKLEKRVVTLENEETKLKTTIQAIETYNTSLEKENQLLGTKITELEQIKNILTERVTLLENDCRKMSDLEQEHSEMEPLLKQISVLQQENAELRDKNDELCTEVETLSSQVATMRVKLTSTPSLNISGSSEENVSLIYEGMRVSPKREIERSLSSEIVPENLSLGAVKRRVDSPSKDIQYSLESESPRLGKVRKCYNRGEVLHDVLGLPLNTSESGFEAELDYFDSSISFSGSEDVCSDEVKILQARITYLEQLLLQNSVKLPENLIKNNKGGHEEFKLYLTERINELETVLRELHINVDNMLEKPDETDSKMVELSDKLQNVVFEKDSSSDASLNSIATTVLYKKAETAESAVETDFSYLDVQQTLKDKIKENAELKEQCENLEQAVDLLRNEFDSCENYWSAKLDDERQMFEQEQKISSDKLNELLIKISEYEEQFASEGKLPMIEENELEKQYIELEEEFIQFREKTECDLSEKDKQIEELRLKLQEYQIKEAKDAAIQVNLLDIKDSQFKLNNLSNVVESSNIFSNETLPHLWNPPLITVQSESADSSLINPELNTSFVWNDTKTEPASTCNSLPASISWQPAKISSPQPHSLSIIPDSASSYRVKRSRKHERNTYTAQRTRKEETGNNERRFNARWNNFDYRNGEQTCVVSISSIHHLHRRLHELDQHCRHLQFVLKQQQQHSESVMHHCWKQYRDELSEMQLHLKSLQEKLSRSDMLIKDLYVENTHLIANNQRLEHRCHMLIQCNTESTSV